MKFKTGHFLVDSKRMEDYDIVITGTDMRTDMMEVISSLPGDHIWTVLQFIKEDWDGVSNFLVEPSSYIKEGFLQYKALPEEEQVRITDTIYNGTMFKDDRDATIDLLTEELDKWWQEISQISAQVHGPPEPPSPPKRRLPPKRPRLPPKRPRADLASTSREEASPPARAPMAPARAPRAQRPPRAPRAPPAPTAPTSFGDMARSYFTGLEEKVKELQEENAKLRGQVDDLAAAVRLLGKNFF
jgi:hypothetical protein